MVQKGAVVALVQATDYKSVMLSIVILLSSILTVSITTEASIAARRRELALLSTVGWRPRTLLRAVTVELILIGAAAGIAGTLVSYPITKIAQLNSNPLHMFVAIPAAIIVALLAGLSAAIRGAKTHPATINVRTPDLVAAGCLGLLGLVSVAMVLFMGLTEDAAMYASLQAIGWKDWRIGWIVTLQSLIISAIGCLLGGALSIAGVHWLVTAMPPTLWQTWLQISAGALMLTLMVALIPTLHIMRMNTARVLTVE